MYFFVKSLTIEQRAASQPVGCPIHNCDESAAYIYIVLKNTHDSFPHFSSKTFSNTYWLHSWVFYLKELTEMLLGFLLILIHVYQVLL